MEKTQANRSGRKNLSQESIFLLRGPVLWIMLELSGYSTTEILKARHWRVFFLLRSSILLDFK